MSGRQLNDFDKTIEQIKRPSQVMDQSWLRHKGQAGRIDYMILDGATKSQIANELIKKGLSKRDFETTERRVQRHIDHLRKEVHMLPLIEDNRRPKWFMEIWDSCLNI
jgi:hypothetical protein